MDTRLPQSESQSDPYFDFMELPRELRDFVYGFALARPDPICLPIHHGSLQNDSDPSALPGSASHAPAGTKSGTSSPGKTLARDNLSPAILRVSKTVYNEARPVLYGSNTFTMSVRGAFQAVQLLSASRNLVRHLRFEFSNSTDLFKRFAPLVRMHLRYFRKLKDLVLVFPEDRSGKDWEVFTGENILTGEPSKSFFTATGMLLQATDWVPTSTKITLVGVDFGHRIDWRHSESAKDREVEAAIQNMIQRREGSEGRNRDPEYDSTSQH